MKTWQTLYRLATAFYRKSGGNNINSDGYTIMETLVVLGVTSLMFAAMLVAFNGRQARTEFTQAVRDYESMLQGIISDVNNGYYSSDGYKCISAGPDYVPDLALSPSNETGTNGDCIFIGKLLGVGLNGASPQSEYNTVYPMIGSRITEVAGATTAYYNSFQENYKNTTIGIGMANAKNNTFQLQTVKAYYKIGAVEKNAKYIAFINNKTNPVSGGGQSTENQVVFLPFDNAFFYSADGKYNVSNPMSTTPAKITLCLKGQNGQRAEIELGSDPGVSGAYSAGSILTVLDTEATGVCA